MCVPAQRQNQDTNVAASLEKEKHRVSWRSGHEEVEICDHPRWISDGEPKYKFDKSDASPDERAKLTRTPSGQWRKQTEKPVVPQPTSTSNPPPTLDTALQIDGREILEELVKRLPLFDAAESSTDFTTPPESQKEKPTVPQPTSGSTP